MTDAACYDPSDRLRWHGRRRGYALRKGRQTLIETLLPRLRVPVTIGGAPTDLMSLFPKTVEDVWLEVGFGAGEHMVEQVRFHPAVGMIGCEPFINGVAALLARVERDNLSNVRVFDDDARLLLSQLPDAAIGRVFVLFADPWPKMRHHKRRFLAEENLDALARVMKDDAELRFASDHMEFVRWTLDKVTRHPAFQWPARSPDAWRRRPDDWFETRYEAKALAKGETCAYLAFRRRRRRDGVDGAADLSGAHETS